MTEVVVCGGNSGFEESRKNVTAKILEFEVRSSRGKGRRKQTWKIQAEDQTKKTGLVKEGARDRTKWRSVIKSMVLRNPANFVDEEDGSKLKLNDDDNV